MAGLPSPDSAMALRLRRQRMALYSYALAWGGMLAGRKLDLFSADTPHLVIFGGVFMLNGLVWLAIRSGWSTRLRDPSLTVPQMMIGAVFITVVLHYATQIRGTLHLAYFMVMTFGVFALDRRRMALMWLFVMGCYSVLIAWHWWLWPGSRLVPMNIGRWSILALGLAWFAYVGGNIYNLQRRYRRQRQALRHNESRLRESNERLQSALRRLAELAVRDELTGLFNRRYFLERLQEEVAEAERGLHPLHVALIDLDHFKRINDRHGHQKGDAVLRVLARAADQELRLSDVVARYGGEEFIVLFPEGDTAQIRQVLERLRQAFSELSAREPGVETAVTLSAGLAAWKPGDRAEDLIGRADAALYRAKAAGRNQMTVA